MSPSDSTLWRIVQAAVESGAGVPFADLMEDPDLLFVTEQYLQARAKELNKQQRGR